VQWTINRSLVRTNARTKIRTNNNGMLKQDFLFFFQGKTNDKALSAILRKIWLKGHINRSQK